MKGFHIVLLTGWLTLNSGFTAIAAAECGPPTEEEIKTHEAAIFAEADVDKSNSLSLSEFATFTKLFETARTERHFSCLDANGDGQVSTDELAAHRPPRGPHHHRRPF